MSYTYLREQGGVSSAESFSDIPVSVLLNLSLMQENVYLQDNGTKSCQNSQFGMISPLLMQSLGREKSTLSVEDSPARTFHQLVRVQGLEAKEVGYGNIWQELFMKFNQDTFLLKTHHCLWEMDLQLSSVILPQWGMMQDGVFWEQMILGVITHARDAGYWPTPLKSEGPGGQQMKLTDAIAIAEGFKPRYFNLDGMEGRQAFTGKVNSEWAKWLMGWPMGWTDVSTELAMDKFQSWLQWHGESWEAPRQI